MEEVETAQISTQYAKTIQANVHREWTEFSQVFNIEKEELKYQLDRLGTEYKALTQSLPSELLFIYENLRLSKQGLAVTTVRDNTCSSCGTSLTLALTQEARSSAEITYCPTCGRILFCE